MNNIRSLLAREILDSRGNPTVEVEISDGTHVLLAKVPSGASTGIHEALELRDGDKSRFSGKGVLKAVYHVNTIIAPALLSADLDLYDQEAVDNFLLNLDGTPNKSNLGANAILGVSMAVCRLAAAQKNIPLWQYIHKSFEMISKLKVSPCLPRPMMNIMNGGKHADSGIAIQEFMIFPNLKKFSDNLRAGAEIFGILKKILAKKKLTISVGDEGGFAPRIKTTIEVFALIEHAIEEAGYKGQVEFAIDPAASEFFGEKNMAKKDHYLVDGKNMTAEELTHFYVDLTKKFSLVSIEDSHAEDDFEGFQFMNELLGDTIQLVGDDLFVTNVKRLQMGIDKKLANAILIKVNQIGSLTETYKTIALAKKNNMNCIISHRSGETIDDFIADLAVGTAAGQIKTGSLCRSERICKYNQLLRIEEQLN